MRTVLQLMDYAAPYEGNFIPSIRNLKGHLDCIGVRMIYLFPESAEKIQWANKLKDEGEILYFISSSFFSKKVKYSNIDFLGEIVRKEKVDVIHTHFVAYNYTLVLMKYTILRKVRIVGNFMNEFHPPFNKYRRIKIFITKISFDVIIGSSAAVVQSLREAGIKDKMIQQVNNALDIKHLQKSEVFSIRDYRGQKVILMFGWPYYRKGIDIGIKAVKDLINEGYDFLIAIALAGSQALISDEIINDFGEIPAFVRFLYPRNDASAYYNAADIFLSASREEGLAYSVLEASYCDPLVVVSDIGGHAKDIPYISVYNVEDIKELKEIILTLISLPTESKIKIKDAQKEYVSENYNVDTWSESIIKCYKA